MWQLMLNVSVIDVQRMPKCVHPFVRQFMWLVFVCGLNKSSFKIASPNSFTPTEWALFFKFVVCSMGTLDSSLFFDSVLVS